MTDTWLTYDEARLTLGLRSRGSITKYIQRGALRAQPAPLRYLRHEGDVGRPIARLVSGRDVARLRRRRAAL